MAKVLFGPIVSDARKKIGGVVFSKSRFGAYVRRKVSPVQPRTASVRAVRANFSADSKAWSGTLDDPARLSFRNLAATITKKDRFGNSQTLTGAQIYTSIARNLHTISVDMLALAPTDLSTTDIGGATLDEVSPETSPLTGFGMSVDTTNAPADAEYLVVAAAPPQPAGRSFIGKGKYRIIQVVAPAGSSPYWDLPVDITTAYISKFGDLAVGQVIHVLVFVINSLNGGKGTPYPASLTLV